MTVYMLDTTCFVLLAKRNSVAKSAFERLVAGGHVLGTCPVSLAEYYAGRPRGDRPEVDAFIDDLECWPILRADGLHAGEYRRALRNTGIQVTTPDMLIAAVAARVSATVITENLKDFVVAGALPISLLSV
jgi:predicted nucleic acid-binding protein